MSYGLCGASKEDRDYYELKQAAAEYYRSRNVPERLEEALNSTFFLSPEDVYGHLANYFAQFSKTPIICSIRGKKVLDGTGKATVEVEVLCTVKNTDKLPTELAMPIPMITLLSYGKSSPGKLNLMKEVLVFPKPGLTMQQSVDMAVALQKQIVKQIDSASKTGSVMKNVSPLGCLVLGCDRVDQPLDLISEACEHLGLELGTNLHLAINCAAHELMDYNKGKYEVVTGTFKSPDEMVDMYVDVISRHPAVVALIDPLRKEDALQWQSMGTTLGSRCYLIADVASKSVSNLLINRTVKIPMSSGIVIKHSNETTVSDLMEVFRLVEGEKHVTVLGCKYEESVDDSLVDLAVGLGARFIKLGGLLRGERTTKYNRLLAIEEGLTQNGTLGKQPEHEFPVLCNDIQSPTSQEEEQRLKCVQTAEKPGGAHIR
ncbi:hypothetical protein FKM82_014686 [Ascaphus truei]